MSDSVLPGPLMDLLTLSSPRAVFQNQARLAEIKFTNARAITFAGGTFVIDAAMLGYLAHQVHVGAERAVIIDSTGVPVLIDDMEDFLDICSSQYHGAVNAYYDEIQRMRSNRDVSMMVEVN